VNNLLLGGAGDGVLFVCICDPVGDGLDVHGGPDSQGTPERSAPHGLVETLRRGVQPSAAPWQPVPRIGTQDKDVMPLLSRPHLRDHSQQC
jgi:hypothetical protein